MPAFSLPYGKTYLTLNLPDDYRVQVLNPVDVPAAPDPARLVDEALANPLGEINWADVERARSVAVVISDKTRPIPHAALLPLLAWLEARGFSPQAITLLIATGTHIPMLPDEFFKVLPPEVLSRYPVFCHDCDDQSNLVTLGTTTRGTPVSANRRFMDADLRIVVGNIEPHQFMGFSGGVKSAAIGLAGRETINTNHAMMVHPRSDLAEYDQNPTRQDIEEIGRMMDIHLALNTIINRHKAIVHVLAGDPVAVMRAGMPLVRQLYEIAVDEPFDVVFTCPGGYPKDINLYQGQKAMSHASKVTKDGGTIVLVAACSEGTGSKGYENWIAGMQSHEAVLKRFAGEEFRLGPHKAFQIARDAVRVRLILLTEMSPDFVRGLLVTPACTIDEAAALALKGLPSGARIGIIPIANATIPNIVNY